MSEIFATMLLHFVDPFNLICNMTMNFAHDPIPRVVGVGVCGQNICYHVAAFMIPSNLICNMTVF